MFPMAPSRGTSSSSSEVEVPFVACCSVLFELLLPSFSPRTVSTLGVALSSSSRLLFWFVPSSRSTKSGPNSSQYLWFILTDPYESILSANGSLGEGSSSGTMVEIGEAGIESRRLVLSFESSSPLSCSARDIENRRNDMMKRSFSSRPVDGIQLRAIDWNCQFRMQTSRMEPAKLKPRDFGLFSLSRQKNLYCSGAILRIHNPLSILVTVFLWMFLISLSFITSCSLLKKRRHRLKFFGAKIVSRHPTVAVRTYRFRFSNENHTACALKRRVLYRPS